MASKLLQIILLATFSAGGAHASASKVRGYINGLTYLYSKFTQTNSDSSVYFGELYLDRSKDMGRIFMICRDKAGREVQRIETLSGQIQILNLSDKTVSVCDINQGPAGLFLKKQIDWGKFPITEISKNADGGDFAVIDVGGGVLIKLEFNRLGVISGWSTFEDNKPQVTIKFDPKTTRVNDPKYFKKG